MALFLIPLPAPLTHCVPVCVCVCVCRSVKDAVLSRTSAGGCCVNDVVLHVGNGELPFGGVGPSGMGAYHGQSGFDTFSHLKPVLEKYGVDPPLRFPPFTPFKTNVMRTMTRYNRACAFPSCFTLLLVLALLAALGVLIWRASLAS